MTLFLNTQGRIFNFSMPKDFNFEFAFKNYFSKCTYLSGIQGLQDFKIQIQPFAEGIDKLPEFENYHSMMNKQRYLNYNPKNCLQTGVLILTYNDFNNDDTYNIAERVNFFIQDVLARILGFLQNRRIIIDILKIQNAKQEVWAMPPFMNASYIDSVAFGPEIIPRNQLANATLLALEAYFNKPSDQQINLIGILKRFNDLLNLPYAYERAESLWKIIEALPFTPLIKNVDSTKLEIEYKRLLGLVNSKGSKNLKNFLTTLVAFNTIYSDQDIIDAWKFRNENTHEFLNFNAIYLKQAGAYQFLIKTLRKILEELFDLKHLCIEVGSTCIDGRVF